MSDLEHGLAPVDAAYLAGLAVISAGQSTVPSLLTTQSTDVAVTLRIPYPDTAYQAMAWLTGGVSLLAALSITTITKTSGSVVTVRVQNTGLITLAGATVLVLALRD